MAQASRGKFDRLYRTPAGSTALTLDGCGLRDSSPARPARDASYPISVRQVAVLLHTSFRHRLAEMPLRFAKPSPPSGWLGDLHPQAIEHARHATNPLRASRAASAAIATRQEVRHNRRAQSSPRTELDHVSVVVDTLACRLTQPRVAAQAQRCLQLSDSADDLKRTKPILAKLAPYSHWLCLLLHLVSHLSTGPLEKTSAEVPAA